MTWKEIFKFGKKLETTKDKIKFYSVFVATGLAAGIAYSVIPFTYSDAFLKNEAKKDLASFIKSNKVVEDKRFTFLKREDIKDCYAYTAYSKYTPYSFTRIKCKEEVLK